MKLELNLSIPSLHLRFQLKGSPTVVSYSEHHLDYADGVSVYQNAKSLFATPDFGASLAHLDDTQVVERFVTQILAHLPST